MIEKKINSKGTSARVKFELPGDAARESAAVVGDFNDWKEDGSPMKYVRSRKVWSTTIKLDTDRTYEFRYLADGENWINDDEADGTAPNPYFGVNSVIRL